MARAPIRTIHSDCCHFGWDRATPPVTTVAPGTVLTLACRDAADGQIGPSSRDGDLALLDPGRANPVTGPVYVDGAEPGDGLTVRFLDFTPSGFGWAGIIPGFGLLAGEFSDPRLRLFSYDTAGVRPVAFDGLAEIPLAPFAGTVGAAPATPGPHGVIPPRRVGGNLDIRDMRAGTVLTLPVEVPGALLSIGDTHAAQGDGEVCGTAIESAMDVTVEIGLVKGAAPAFPRYETAGPRPGSEAMGRVATTGVGPDLMDAARDAVRGMIDHLSRDRSTSPEDAYILCSLAADLVISEVVDAPNWVVSCSMPRALFTDRAAV